MLKSATAKANPNIALIKYWGKRDAALNIPATGSLSLTLDKFHTITKISRAEKGYDQIYMNGELAGDKEAKRISSFVALFRDVVGNYEPIIIDTNNNFPTASGLASSASGFAALAIALNEFYELGLGLEELSAYARRGSGSAPRSLFGGFVEMSAGEKKGGEDAVARQLATSDYWDIRLIAAVNGTAQKKVGSTEGMERTRETSPYWNGWLECNRGYLEEAKKALKERDFKKLGELTEASCFAMHACALAARPHILYWNSVTVAAMEEVWRMREEGAQVYCTIDAGSHLKALTTEGYAEEAARRLAKVEGISTVHINRPGEGAQIIERVS